MADRDMAHIRSIFDEGQGKYARRTGLAFNRDWFNAGLEAVWNAATEARWEAEFKALEAKNG